MKTLHILNLGAGVQSTALYLMSMNQDEPEHVPVFDYAIFADTQEEPKAVYDHLQWLKSLGGPPIIEATAGKLGDDLIRAMNTTGQPFQCIPAFTLGSSGDKGMRRRQCTKEYKIEVVEKEIRRTILGLLPGGRFPKDIAVVQHMGLSFNEPRRIIRVKQRFDSISWANPRFSLFDLEMSRRSCQTYLETRVPHPVPKSACVFCPFRDNTSWRHLRDTDPAGWERACEVDEGMRANDTGGSRGLDLKSYVHRSCVPLRVAPIDTPESRGEQYQFGFAQECEGMCGV
jgi:hypothetical protein